jgi:hypothetical protein
VLPEQAESRSFSLRLSSSSGPATAPTKDDEHPQQEPEVVRDSVVVNLVHLHTTPKQRNDKCHRSDQPVPQSMPEASNPTGFRLAAGQIVGAGHARADCEEDSNRI